MKLKERLDQDFIKAFKDKNTLKKNLLGVIRGDIQTQTANGVDMTDENIIKIIKKIKKGLVELNTDEANEELSYLEPYLPQLMSNEEIEIKLNELLESNPNANIGFIMGFFNKNYNGMVDNTALSKLIKEKINA